MAGCGCPIPSGLLVREARLDGKLVSLVSASGKGASQLSAVLAHAGRAVLLLDIALPVNASAGEERISLPSTSSGVTRAAVQLPRQGVDVKLSGGLLTEKTEAGDESKWLAYARGNEPLTFTWHRKIEDHHITLPLRQRGSLTQLTSLAEDSTSLYAEVNLEITQGAAKEARIQLPENITINQVSGGMVADWEVKAGELVVTFLEPVEQSARFIITGETKTPRDGHIDISLLRLLNTERDTGGVAVEVLGAGEIKDLKTQGLENADAAELGDYVAARQSPSMVAFHFRSSDAKAPRSLAVDIARYAQQAVLMANIEEARYRVLLSKEGKSLVQAQYAIRNNQRNFLKITLPAGAAIWSASLAGKPVRPGEAKDGSLLLPLEKSRAGEEAPAFVLEIFYLVRQTAWTDKGKATLALPAVDLPISRTGLLLYHPPLFKLAPETGTFRVESYEAPSWPPLSALSTWERLRNSDLELRQECRRRGRCCRPRAALRNPPRRSWSITSRPKRSAAAAQKSCRSAPHSPHSGRQCFSSLNSRRKITLRPWNSTISATRRKVANEKAIGNPDDVFCLCDGRRDRASSFTHHRKRHADSGGIQPAG